MAKAWFRFKRPSQPADDALSAADKPATPGEPPVPHPAPGASAPETAPEASDTAVAASPAEIAAEPDTEPDTEPVEAATAEEQPEAELAADAPVEEEEPIGELGEESEQSEDAPPITAPSPNDEEAIEERVIAEPTVMEEPAAAEPLEPSPDEEPSEEPSALPSYVDALSAGDWLARLAQISAVTAYKALSYNLLDLKPGERAVDVGCGLGADARELAWRVGATGSVVGVDSSAEMIARATDATDADAARTLRFVTADATALPLETGGFDALRADRLLQHVDDPLQALVEFRRVLRPGARIVLVEPDWKTMAVYPGSADGADNDHCVAAIFDWQVAHTRHPLIGRQLRMLLALAGFVSISVTPVAYASTRFIEADLTLELSRAAAGAAEQWPARLSQAEAEAWRVTAQAADAAGHFFASVPLFFAHATVE